MPPSCCSGVENGSSANTKKAHDWKFGSALFCVALRFIFAAELQRGRAGIRSGWD